MAKTIAYQVPGSSYWAGEEIAFGAGTAPDLPGRGMIAIAKAINAIYEGMRGALIRDMRHDVAIASALGHELLYRARTQGRSEIATEAVRLYIWANIQLGTGAVSITLALGASTPVAFSIGASTTGFDLINLGVANWPDAAEYELISVKITTLTGTATVDIRGVYLGYDRPRTSLLDVPATTSGANGGYPQSNFIPLDLIRYRDDAAMSVQKLHEIIRDLTYLRRRAYAMIATVGYRAGTSMPGVATSMTRASARIPERATHSKWHLLTEALAGSVSIIQESNGASLTMVITAAGWYSGSLAVAAGQDRETFSVSRAESSSVRSLCGYWEEQ